MVEANKVAIITDSVACIPKELVEKYEIEVVPVEVHFGDKVYRDGVDITPSQFYAMLRQAKKLPTTAASLPGRFIEAYQKLSSKAANILCITLSTKFSGMFDSARLAMDNVKKTMPHLNIELIDSQTAASAQGFIVLAAARTAASGESLAKVMEATKSMMHRVRLLVMVDTLRYLIKGGRVPKIAALADVLLRIKPILTISDGEATALTNARTTFGAMKRLLQLMEQRIVKELPLHVAVMHADALNQAIELKNQISSQFNCAELFITEFTPVMGAHTGPGVIGVAFYNGE